MKRCFIIAAALTICVSAMAQDVEKAEIKAPEDGFKFEVVKQNPITPVKNQASSGTCWCFSTLSFIESELIRQGCADPDLDLSEMFVVSNAYADKAVKYIRVDGHLNYSQGSSFGDVFHVLKDHGIVPDEIMTGLNYGTTKHAHYEMEAGLKGYMDGILKNPNRTLSTAWLSGLKGILAAYLGPVPETFTYKGKEYTPKSYLESLPFNADDYVDFTSWTHLSYYEKHPVEVADNWRWEQAYNIPLDDMMRIIDNAIEKGYTVAWASDVSETGFTRDGIGIVPDMEAVNAAGSDQAHWVGTLPNGRKTFNGPVKEIEITPELRQKGYEEKSTTDDHGMHLYGIAKDANGTKYYIVKNSWGLTGKYSGIWYVSESYVKYKTMDFTVHKDAVPKDIRKKLGIK
ncbi:MAG: aminopeptidase [Bacteroidales bacterium]|nr:aminopeptidase [Candidatus Cacconaster merdequi]